MSLIIFYLNCNFYQKYGNISNLITITEGAFDFNQRINWNYIYIYVIGKHSEKGTQNGNQKINVKQLLS